MRYNKGMLEAAASSTVLNYQLTFLIPNPQFLIPPYWCLICSLSTPYLLHSL
jgi:hypothetical protein